ncbi:MAG: division/cell wall cluster transcriptional repressor MraZ [Opitutales bacterium]
METDAELYFGEFQHVRDAKGRLTVPSKWRFKGDEEQTYLALPDPLGCITVYPPKMVADLKAKLADISLGDKKSQRAIMRLLGSADSITFDKTGRIKVSDRLYEHAGIDKDVLCVGTLNKFHLWEPERYQQHVRAEDEEGGEDLADILQGLGF